MELKEKKLLKDMLEAISSIDMHLQGKRDFNLFLNNKTIRRSVERELEIIGEAMNNLLKLNPNTGITNAQKIVDLRNYVIHAYDSVDNEMIWTIVVKHLPLLKIEVETLLILCAKKE